MKRDRRPKRRKRRREGGKAAVLLRIKRKIKPKIKRIKKIAIKKKMRHQN